MGIANQAIRLFCPAALDSTRVTVTDNCLCSVGRIVSVRVLVVIAIALVLSGCSEKPVSTVQVSPAIVLKVLHPPGTPAGIKFNVQSNGTAAIAVECENATRDTVILFDNQPLRTAFGNGSMLTAEVPPEYFSLSLW